MLSHQSDCSGKVNRIMRHHKYHARKIWCLVTRLCVHMHCMGVCVCILMFVPVWDVLCNPVDVICSRSHYGILAASVDKHLMCFIDSN